VIPRLDLLITIYNFCFDRATLHRYNTRMFHDIETKDSGQRDDAGIKLNLDQEQTYDLYEQFQLLENKVTFRKNTMNVEYS